MLQSVLDADDIERFRGFAEVPDELVARDPRLPDRAAFQKSRADVSVGQAHHHDQFIPDDLDALQAEQKRVANRFDLLERFVFLAELTIRPSAPLDEFDRLQQSARRFALPNFAEAAAAERMQQDVSRQRFFTGVSQIEFGVRDSRLRGRDRPGPGAQLRNRDQPAGLRCGCDARGWLRDGPGKLDDIAFRVGSDDREIGGRNRDGGAD